MPYGKKVEKREEDAQFVMGLTAIVQNVQTAAVNFRESLGFFTDGNIQSISRDLQILANRMTDDARDQKSALTNDRIPESSRKKELEAAEHRIKTVERAFGTVNRLISAAQKCREDLGLQHDDTQVNVCNEIVGLASSVLNDVNDVYHRSVHATRYTADPARYDQKREDAKEENIRLLERVERAKTALDAAGKEMAKTSHRTQLSVFDKAAIDACKGIEQNAADLLAMAKDFNAKSKSSPKPQG